MEGRDLGVKKSSSQSEGALSVPTCSLCLPCHRLPADETATNADAHRVVVEAAGVEAGGGERMMAEEEEGEAGLGIRNAVDHLRVIECRCQDRGRILVEGSKNSGISFHVLAECVLIPVSDNGSPINIRRKILDCSAKDV